MGGETFNVAVAEFRTVDGSGKAISSPLAHRFTRAVAKRLSASKQALSGDAQFWNGSSGAVEGSTPDERTQSAIDLAERRGADLLVYGDIRQADGLVTVEAPTLMISNRRLSVELRDLIAHAFVAQPAPTPFLATEDPARMASSMAQQSASLARLLAGLKQFQAGHYAGAAAIVKPLTSAAKEPGRAAGLAANPAREALVSYVLAYGAMFPTSPSAQGFDRAGKLFDEAVRADPSFDRALLGRANITYLQTIANGGCDPRRRRWRCDRRGAAFCHRSRIGDATARGEPHAGGVPRRHDRLARPIRSIPTTAIRRLRRPPRDRAGRKPRGRRSTPSPADGSR